MAFVEFRDVCKTYHMGDVEVRAVGVHVGRTNFGFIIAVALVVAVAARTVGSLIVSSMMVVPVACALQLSRSWKQ